MNKNNKTSKILLIKDVEMLKKIEKQFQNASCLGIHDTECFITSY